MNPNAPFQFAPAEKPCFEDSRAGRLLFTAFGIAITVFCLWHFYGVAMGR